MFNTPVKIMQSIGEEDVLVEQARRKETQLGVLKMFRQIMDAVRTQAEWAEAKHHLSAAELWLIAELAQQPGARIVDLAKAMATHRLTADYLLHNLYAKGYVTSRANEDSGSLHYLLTESGQRIALASGEHGRGVLMSAMAQLPDGSLNTLADALRPLVELIAFREDRAALKPMADLLNLHKETHQPQVVRNEH